MKAAMIRGFFRFSTTVALGALMWSCGGISDRQPANQMMLVRESSGSLGYRKLMAKSQESVDLRTFIDQKGLPDFVAEANSSNRDYLIFYYLDRHQAFACRTRGRGNSNVEFAGPYPITNGEWKLLSGVKSRAGTAAATP